MRLKILLKDRNLRFLEINRYSGKVLSAPEVDQRLGTFEGTFVYIDEIEVGKPLPITFNRLANRRAGKKPTKTFTRGDVVGYGKSWEDLNSKEREITIINFLKYTNDKTTNSEDLVNLSLNQIDKLPTKIGFMDWWLENRKSYLS